MQSHIFWVSEKSICFSPGFHVYLYMIPRVYYRERNGIWRATLRRSDRKNPYNKYEIVRSSAYGYTRKESRGNILNWNPVGDQNKMKRSFEEKKKK